MTRQRRTHWARIVAWGIGVTVCLLRPPASAQEEEDKGKEEAWKAERAKLEEVIAQRIREDVDRTVKKQDIAAALGMKWPVTKPPKSKEEIAAEIDKQIDALAAQQFPDERRKEFEKEAADKYRMYKIGEEVSFPIRGGLGPNAVVKGRFIELTQMRVRVGTRTILRDDIAPEVQAHFWEDVNEEFRTRYIRVQNAQYDAKIAEFKKQKRETMLPEALRAARYLHAPKEQLDLLRRALQLPDPSTRKGERELAEWFPEHDILEMVYAKRREAREAEVKDKITEQVFMSNGYELVENEMDGTKEWMPKKEAVSFRERIKALIEKKKQEELEAGAAKAGDEWGAGEPAGGGPGAPAGGMGEGMMPPGLGESGMPGPGGPGMMRPGQGQGGPGPGMMGPGMMGPGMGGSGGPGPGMMGPGMMGPGGQGRGGRPGGPPAGGAGNTPFDERQ